MKKIVTVLACVALMLVSVPVGGQVETAKVFSVKGNVKVVPEGRSVGVPCKEGMIVNAGDWIKTGKNSTVTLSFDVEDDNTIKIKENTLVILKLDGYFKIHLLAGEIYALLENVEKEESFRVLTPLVVTESMSSGWGATTDGNYTNVVVFDNRVFICGINKDGTVNKQKYWIEEGYQRKTINFQNPGDMKPVPEKMLSWFREQVVAHHLDKALAKEMKEKGLEVVKTEEVVEEEPAGEETDEDKPKDTFSRRPPRRGAGTFIVDGEEINLVEYLYRQRLRQEPGRD